MVELILAEKKLLELNEKVLERGKKIKRIDLDIASNHSFCLIQLS